MKAVSKARKCGIKANVLDSNEDALPFPSEHFDLGFCGELLKHFHNVDRCLAEVARVFKPGSLFVVTTPSMVSRMNRLALLFGYQPYYTETSFVFDLRKFRRKNIRPSGHLRLFAVLALSHLLAKYGLGVDRVQSVRDTAIPWPSSFVDKLLSRRPSFRN